MIGKKIEFKNPNYRDWSSASHPETPLMINGTVLDKITEQHSHVSPAWTRGRSGSDIPLIDTKTYYMVEEDINGIVHRLSPDKIIKIIK